MLFGAPIGDWVQLSSGIGLKVRNPARAWASQSTAILLSYAGVLAYNLQGEFQVADVSSPLKGAEFKPHVSHRWGYDADVGYTLKQYPTPLTTPASDGFVRVLAAIEPAIEVVGVTEARRQQMTEIAAGLGVKLPKLAVWKGHDTHAHVRFRRPQGVIVPGNTAEDDDGASNAQDYILPDEDSDVGSFFKAWKAAVTDSDAPIDEEDEDLLKVYHLVRDVLQEHMDAPELLQKPDASKVLARRAYVRMAENFETWPQTPWPDVVQACQIPTSPPCVFWNAALAYYIDHEI